MNVHKMPVLAGVVLAATAGVITAAVPAHATTTSTTGSKILALKAGDTFITGQQGVLCQVRQTGVLVCMFGTSGPYGVSNAEAKRICGNAALEGIVLSTKSWTWDCATDVQVLPTKQSNAWAVPHHLKIDSRYHAAIIPNYWTFTSGGLPCHVSYNGAVGCAATKAKDTGFVADSRYTYPRGVEQQ
ncbi:hypothetical protein [Allobranchiibius sp. CTAmp26]|uniref:hypothetical protein n=1 Tax=Allobranchiibius sp. CTAmp26 TaxID=2815214 RepID=UPI001AA16A7D|nr:hypothetical protein [Allobranchiibius sp. CTAmp26]MBO1756810.1 hypothetical protein [Allobranchiibius sp. CTAmp26]